MLRIWASVGAATLLLACACSSRPRREVTILGAPALARALEALRPLFEQERRGIAAVVRTRGAAGPAGVDEPVADVLVTDDVERVRRLAEAGTVERPRIVARSRAAILVPARNPGGIRTPRDLARRSVRLVAGTPESPVGAHARRLLERLGRLPGYPRDFADQVEERIAVRAADVDGVLELMALGEGHAALAYESEAHGSRRVRQVDLPPGVEIEVEFVAAVSRTAANREDAGAVLKALLSTRGRDVLRRHGFR